MLKFPNRWQCNLNSYSSLYMGLPDLMVVHVGRGPKTTLDMIRQMSFMDKEKSHVTAEIQTFLQDTVVPRTNELKNIVRQQFY